MAEMPLGFSASAEILLSSPGDIMRKLCAHFVEHGEVTVEGRFARVETGFGCASMEAGESCLKLFAEGKDDTSLAYVKLAMAEHLLHFAETASPRIVWQGDGAAGSPLPYFREMQVTGATSITPHMRRLTLAGDDLGRFASGGLHVRLLIPKDRNASPAWPVTGADGRPAWPETGQRPDVRIYTIRRIDIARGEIDIDFVMHDGDGMPGARFGAEAEIGDIVGMTGPGGGSVGEADWYLLAGDETALPAIGRILAELPAGARAVVRIEVANRNERQDMPSAADVDIEWLCRDGSEVGTSSMLQDAVRAVAWPDPDTRVFAWAGCEHAGFRAIRSYFRQERNLARDAHLAVAYWRRGAQGDAARKEN